MAKQFVVPAIIDFLDEEQFVDGLLFKLHPDLGGSVKLRAYIAERRIGWHRVDHGYYIYVHSSDELGSVRFIGLSPSDTRPTKDLGLRHPFSKQDFERYVDSLVEAELLLKGRIKEEIDLLIHDLRRFSNSIYQNAAATKKAIYEGDGSEASIRIENTLAAQAMLSIRTDILDITESKGFQVEYDKVSVYRKFDKVVKSFHPGCELKGISISISGNSHSRVVGPDCMEIIGYILCDNALKYSPANHKIDVQVRETESSIHVTVTSLGPIIDSGERELIFEKGFRSRAARAVEQNGTGFGLFLARLLVQRFSGTISVEQSGEVIKTNRGEFRDTIFSLEFPIFEKQLNSVHGSFERKGPVPQLPKQVGRSSNADVMDSDKKSGQTISRKERKRREWWKRRAAQRRQSSNAKA